MSVKTVQEREQIVDDILQHLERENLHDGFPAIKQLKGILAEYIKNPDDQPGFTGKIKFPELNTFISYVLPMRSCNNADVRVINPQSSIQSKKGRRQVRALTKKQLLEQTQKQQLTSSNMIIPSDADMQSSSAVNLTLR